MQARQGLKISGWIFMIMGIIHGSLTVLDVFAPTFFTPADQNVRAAMLGSPVVFATLFKSNTNTWVAWLGFNLTHSLGLFASGLWCQFMAHENGLLIQSTRFRILAGFVFVLYVAISSAFMFYLPAIGFAIAALLVLFSLWTLGRKGGLGA